MSDEVLRYGTDDDCIEEIEEKYSNIESDSFQIGKDDYDWLIKKANKSLSLEMKYESTGSIFSRQAMMERIDILEKELIKERGN